MWKHEWVTPVGETANPSTLKDLRKISLTSEFSLIFKGSLKEWIMNDINPNLDKAQFGNRKGTGTEHLLVKLIDQILKLLDRNYQCSGVIASILDCSSEVDRHDPTLAIRKFLSLGVRHSLVPVLVNYFADREMQVKFNGAY